jgi:predicted  nucleic acid-binding Zn-ribbon protein
MLKKLRADAFALKSDAETGDSGCGAILRTAQKEQSRLENSLKNAKSFRDQLQEEIDKLSKQRDDLDSQKLAQEEARATAKKMVTDITARCQAAAEEYHTNSAALSQEVKNLTKGISILKKVFASLLQKQMRAASSFIQEASKSKDEMDKESIDAALSMLATSSTQVHSKRIATLAIQIKMKLGSGETFDPFAKVRDMIENMVSMLKDEAAAETTKADWCATTLATLKSDTDSKRNDKEGQMVLKRDAIANLADYEKLLSEQEEQLADTEKALKETEEELDADVALKTKISAESFTQIEALMGGIEALNEAFTNNADLGDVSGTAASRKGSGEEVIKILEDTKLRAIWTYAKAEQDKACQPDSEATFGWDAKFDDALTPVSAQNCDTGLEPSTVPGLTDESAYTSSTGILSDSINDLKGTISQLEIDIDDTKGKIGVETVNRDDAADLEEQYAGLEKSAEAALKARQKACVNLEDTYEARTKRRKEEIQALEAAVEVLETHSKNAENTDAGKLGFMSTSFLQMSK